MKALLLVDDDRVAEIARFYLKPLGFEAIRYRNPVKAIDNLDEIAPDAVVMSARDYPRHWKVVASVIRSERSKEDCVIVLLKGEYFPFEEAAKAASLGVNGVVRDALDDRKEQAQFQRLLKRYVVVDEARTSDRLAPEPWDRLDLMFAHPKSFVPVAGRLETVSTTGFSFAPDSPALVADLEPGAEIEDCSLRVGDRIVSLSCKLARADRLLALVISSMAEGDRRYFAEYLASCPEREMQALLGR